MIDYRMRLEAMGKTKRDRIIHNAKRMTQKYIDSSCIDKNN